ncbi:MAG: PilZ domain-containing protein [Nakamurella sp.]
MSDQPEIGDPVTLRDSVGLLYVSRVEGIDDGTIAVARPADLRAALEYDIGMELEVVWTEGSGIHVLPTELAETSVERNIRLWHLSITGDGWTEQRRDYVRVPLTGKITITPADATVTAGPDARSDSENGEGNNAGENGDVIEGRLIDFSEVAAQCSVNIGPHDRRLAVGRALRCEFTVGIEGFNIAAKIVIVRPGSTSHDSRVVLEFEHSRIASDALRKQVFQIQIGMRREQQS